MCTFGILAWMQRPHRQRLLVEPEGHASMAGSGQRFVVIHDRRKGRGLEASLGQLVGLR